jgi:hypothetical protein
VSIFLLSLICIPRPHPTEAGSQPQASDAGESAKSEDGFFKGLWNFHRNDWNGLAERNIEEKLHIDISIGNDVLADLKASAPASKQNIPSTASCGATGLGPPCSSVPS